MSIISRKNKSIVASKDDFSTLDASVNDLSKQTSELLSHFGEAKKEVLAPKRPSSPKTQTKKIGGRKSFDIISPPSTNRTLKKRIELVEVDKEEELLPEHAGKSFNELPYEEIKTDEAIKAGITEEYSADLAVEEGVVEASDSTTSIVARPSGSLLFEESPTDSEKATNLVEEKDEPKKNDEPVTETQIKPLAEDGKEDGVTETKTEESGESVEAVIITEDKIAQDDSDKIELDEEPSGGELYVNNLVKKTDKKGYVAPEGQQKPTVFDTNEYHPELHDWSKLENKAGVRGYILALLLVIAGALAYAILSGLEVPFIGKLF